MIAPQDAVAARRKLTNRLIAGRDAGRLVPFFLPDAKLIAGDGSLLLGRDQIIDAFAGQFADRDFVAYVRTSETIQIDADGTRAAERGRWIGTWKGEGADQSGTYLATWRKLAGQWVIENELFVTLG